MKKIYANQGTAGLMIHMRGTFKAFDKAERKDYSSAELLKLPSEIKKNVSWFLSRHADIKAIDGDCYHSETGCENPYNPHFDILHGGEVMKGETLETLINAVLLKSSKFFGTKKVTLSPLKYRLRPFGEEKII